MPTSFPVNIRAHVIERPKNMTPPHVKLRPRSLPYTAIITTVIT